jgi:hypothetical protein
MAWHWSHTADAYDNARENLERLPRVVLLTIVREWAYRERERANRLRFPGGQQIGPSGRVRGFRLPNGLRGLPNETLVGLIWQYAEDNRTCDNGGYNAWMCPYGCHTVPFDSPSEDRS